MHGRFFYQGLRLESAAPKTGRLMSGEAKSLNLNLVKQL